MPTSTIVSTLVKRGDSLSNFNCAFNEEDGLYHLKVKQEDYTLSRKEIEALKWILEILLRDTA